MQHYILACRNDVIKDLNGNSLHIQSYHIEPDKEQGEYFGFGTGKAITFICRTLDGYDTLFGLHYLLCVKEKLEKLRNQPSSEPELTPRFDLVKNWEK